MQARDPDQHPSHQLPKDRGQLETHHHFGDGPGGDEDHHKAAHLNQGFRHFKLVGTEFQEKWGDGKHREEMDLRIYRGGNTAVGAAQRMTPGNCLAVWRSIGQAPIPELLLKGTPKPGLVTVARHLAEQQHGAQAQPAKADKQEQGHKELSCGAQRAWAEPSATGLSKGAPASGSTAYTPARSTSAHSVTPPHYGIDPKFAAKSLMSKRRNLKAQTEDLT